jgi:hypothetical protein
MLSVMTCRRPGRSTSTLRIVAVARRQRGILLNAAPNIVYFGGRAPGRMQADFHTQPA